MKELSIDDILSIHEDLLKKGVENFDKQLIDIINSYLETIPLISGYFQGISTQ